MAWLHWRTIYLLGGKASVLLGVGPPVREPTLIARAAVTTAGTDTHIEQAAGRPGTPGAARRELIAGN